MNNPLVSVIVPNYNHAQFLRQRLDSIYAQTFTDFEVIVLDDCSTDNSREIIESYSNRPRFISLFAERNSGSPFAQWMKGMERSPGKYIWIAESDDYCDSNFLEKAVVELQGGADLFYARSVSVDENGNKIEYKSEWTDDLSPVRWKSSFRNDARMEVNEFLSRKNTLPNASAVVFKRTARVPEMCRGSASMKYCGDWLFWIKYLNEAATVSYSVGTCNYFRRHAGVTRLNTDVAKRNAEIEIILQFILDNVQPVLSREELIAYFRKEHFTGVPEESWTATIRKWLRG